MTSKIVINYFMMKKRPLMTAINIEEGKDLF